MPRVVSCNWMPDGEYEVYLAAAPTTQPAHQQEAQEPVAVVVPCHTPSGKRVALYSAKQDLPIGTQIYTAPQPSPAAQGDPLTADEQDGLYWRLHSLSKSLEGRGRIDEYDTPDAYRTILDAMNALRDKKGGQHVE